MVDGEPIRRGLCDPLRVFGDPREFVYVVPERLQLHVQRPPVVGRVLCAVGKPRVLCVPDSAHEGNGRVQTYGQLLCRLLDAAER